MRVRFLWLKKVHANTRNLGIMAAAAAAANANQQRKKYKYENLGKDA